jgi:hypothetical protein
VIPVEAKAATGETVERAEEREAEEREAEEREAEEREVAALRAEAALIREVEMTVATTAEAGEAMMVAVTVTPATVMARSRLATPQVARLSTRSYRPDVGACPIREHARSAGQRRPRPMQAVWLLAGSTAPPRGMPLSESDRTLQCPRLLTG